MKKVLIAAASAISPIVALAQTNYSPSTGIFGLVDFIHNLIGVVFPVLISLAVVYFVWQVFRFAIAANDEDKGKAKTHMIWGIVGIFVMVSVWGLVGILISTFGTGSGNTVTLPTLP